MTLGCARFSKPSVRRQNVSSVAIASCPRTAVASVMRLCHQHIMTIHEFSAATIDGTERSGHIRPADVPSSLAT